MALHSTDDVFETLSSVFVGLLFFSPPLIFVVGAAIAWEGPPLPATVEDPVCVAHYHHGAGAYDLDAACLGDLLRALAPHR